MEQKSVKLEEKLPDALRETYYYDVDTFGDNLLRRDSYMLEIVNVSSPLATPPCASSQSRSQDSKYNLKSSE